MIGFTTINKGLFVEQRYIKFSQIVSVPTTEAGAYFSFRKPRFLLFQHLQYLKMSKHARTQAHAHRYDLANKVMDRAMFLILPHARAHNYITYMKLCDYLQTF